MHLVPDINSFKRSAITMLYIITLFLGTFIPFITVLVIKMRRGGGPRLNITYNFFATFVYFNSSLNPFVYCFRLKEIRIAVFKILGRKYTIDMNGDVVPVSRTISNQRINYLKNSHVHISSSSADLCNTPETNVWTRETRDKEHNRKALSDPRVCWFTVGKTDRHTRRTNEPRRRRRLQNKKQRFKYKLFVILRNLHFPTFFLQINSRNWPSKQNHNPLRKARLTFGRMAT